MVHESSDPSVKYKIAVVGLLYKVGQPDQFLSKVSKIAPNPTSAGLILMNNNMQQLLPRRTHVL